IQTYIYYAIYNLGVNFMCPLTEHTCNQNGRGASIEKVISEAAKIGLNREHAISYIEHLKQNGYAYEPISGEIRCAF
ncbi:MAG: hypothetical protein SCH70_05510, partial [Candidatus Methanoperedens sp.]|nr:hypothetical protein [Candidatus Methanoperedens sp.]